MSSKPARRAQYFSRAVLYAKRAGKVCLFDLHDASLSQPLDPWFGKVFLLADGSHTVDELIGFVSRLYQGPQPESLERTIDSVVERLFSSDLIRFTDEPTKLPYYLDLPADEQDSTKTRALIEADGFSQARPVSAVH